MFGTKLVMREEKDLAALREITTQTKEASALLTKVFNEKSNGIEKDLLRIRGRFDIEPEFLTLAFKIYY